MYDSSDSVKNQFWAEKADTVAKNTSKTPKRGNKSNKNVWRFYKNIQETFPILIVFDKKSKTGLGFEIEHRQQKLWHSPNLTNGQFSCRNIHALCYFAARSICQLTSRKCYIVFGHLSIPLTYRPNDLSMLPMSTRLKSKSTNTNLNWPLWGSESLWKGLRSVFDVDVDVDPISDLSLRIFWLVLIEIIYKLIYWATAAWRPAQGQYNHHQHQDVLCDAGDSIGSSLARPATTMPYYRITTR